MKPATIINILVVAVLLVCPYWLNPYWVDVLNSIGMYAVLALSLNIILGYAGLFHMGHAAFFAMGTYTTAILNTQFGIPVLWLLPLSGMVAGFFALVVARPIIHLRGDYLLIVTIGIVEIVRIALVNNIFGITGGANGIFGISRPNLFGQVIRTPHEFYYLIFAFAAITVLLFLRLENSRFGRALNYIREDDTAAEGSGIDTAHYKLVAFVLGAFWAGMVGNIFAAKMTIISPASFNFWESGNICGVLLGAFLIIGLPEVFREFSSARMLVFGAAMILMMIFRPKGILPPAPRTYNLDFLSAETPKGAAR